MTNELRDGLPPLTPKMRNLPIDERGYPVPFFVAIIDNKPDHRVANQAAMKACIEQNRCWLCGGPLGRHRAFVIGPMCMITLTSSEPPSHLECAEYAVKACPFLSKPQAKRREAGMPEDLAAPGGVFITRNPMAVAIWVSTTARPFKAQIGNPGVLFDLGEPEAVVFWKGGRLASRAEVESSIDSGLPELARQQNDSGRAALDARVLEVRAMLAGMFPAESAS